MEFQQKENTFIPHLEREMVNLPFIFILRGFSFFLPSPKPRVTRLNSASIKPLKTPSTTCLTTCREISQMPPGFFDIFEKSDFIFYIKTTAVLKKRTAVLQRYLSQFHNSGDMSACFSNTRIYPVLSSWSIIFIPYSDNTSFN